MNTIIAALFMLSWCVDIYSSAHIDVELLRPIWKDLAEQHHSPDRQATLQTALSKASGIYDHEHGSAALRKTVIVQVIESHENDPGNSEKYRQQLLNFYCYSQQHRLKSLLFLIAPTNDWFQHEKRMYEAFNPLVQVLPYPYEMFWRLVMRKATNITLGSGRGDYNASIPTFPNFGSLPMLVPVLETLQLGYDTIYLDTDMVFLQDPVPVLTKGKADIVLTPELKVCKFPSLGYLPHWKQVEPNTGTLLLRSNARTISFMSNWLDRIVVDNAMNDQRTMHPDQHGRSMWVRDCDLDPVLAEVTERGGTLGDGGVKYCMLNEFLFFTGLLEVYCSRGRRGASETVFSLAMARMSISHPVGATVDPHAGLKQFNLYDFLAANLSSYSHYHHPIAFHANYCGTKSKCFRDRDLWLLQDMTCAPFNLSTSYYAKINWTEKLTASQEALSRALTDMLTKTRSNVSLPVDDIKQRLEGMAVMFPRSTPVYKVENGRLRPFSSMAAMQHHKYSVDQVVHWGHEMLQLLPIGKPL